MGTTLFTSCSLTWTCHHQQTVPSHSLVAQSSLENGISRTKVAVDSRGNCLVDGEAEKFSGFLKRRSVLASGISLLSSAVIGFPSDSLAVVKQGLLAGRIPGLSEPNEEGWFLCSYISLCSVLLLVFSIQILTSNSYKNYVGKKLLVTKIYS